MFSVLVVVSPILSPIHLTVSITRWVCFAFGRQSQMFHKMSILWLKQVKARALVSAEMKSIHQKRVDDDERLKLEVEQVFKEIQRYLVDTWCCYVMNLTHKKWYSIICFNLTELGDINRWRHYCSICFTSTSSLRDGYSYLTLRRSMLKAFLPQESYFDCQRLL